MSFNTPLLLLLLSLSLVAGIRLPEKVYGVNLGNWLIIEPWMMPQKWLDMGGEDCSDCSKCIRSEHAFAEAYPDTVDDTFAEHWSTWFTRDDVDALVDAGINTVRIPVGYWIIEPLVDRESEHYPRGGLHYLKRGLRLLNDAGIAVILGHHALPGVQSPNQMFTGRCTDRVEFYTDYNYHRALVWTAIMTAMSHLDPDFKNVVSIQAVNEPIMDAKKTPGFGDFQHNFVKVVRSVEDSLGVSSGHSKRDGVLRNMGKQHSSGIFGEYIEDVLQHALDILERDLKDAFEGSFGFNKKPLITNFMDIHWQFNSPSNPADAARGPQNYDNHIYYSFGGVADANEDAYMKSICNLNRAKEDEAVGNTPLIFGEWSLATQFGVSDSFLRKWADAQKWQLSRGAGWIFWNFKIEQSDLAGDLSRQWSYLDGIKRGFFTKDPSHYFNGNVCDPYKNW